MHTPSAALAWELWRRHRSRLLLLAAVLLAFILIYPILCTIAGFNTSAPNAEEELVRPLQTISTPSHLTMVIHVLSSLFLIFAPGTFMAITVFFVIWMFTFTESNPRTKDPLSFPVRLFTLPISTPFLLNWLRAAGLASVFVLCEIWNHLVRMPHLEMFAPFQNVCTWLTLLVLTQGITWALAGWPVTRVFILSGIMVGFLCAMGYSVVFDSPFFLAPIFFAGYLSSTVGLQKIRHGQWQGWKWQWPLASTASRSELRQRQFTSPAQAQFWFEWRRFARRLSALVAIWAVPPVLLHLLVRAIFGLGPLQENTLAIFVVYLLALPVVMHFCFALAPPQADLPFLMNRPLTNGQIMTATLQATGLTTLLSWAAALAMMCLLPMLGDFHGLLISFRTDPQARLLLVLGLTLLTWRMIPSSLCFTLSGRKRLSEMPVWMLLGLFFCWMLLIWLTSTEFWDDFLRCAPVLMFILTIAKICLAVAAFLECLKRRLLTVSALGWYTVFWVTLVAALIAIRLLLDNPELPDMLMSCFAIILLVPLARIGFCPIVLSWNRHA